MLVEIKAKGEVNGKVEEAIFFKWEMTSDQLAELQKFASDLVEPISVFDMDEGEFKQKLALRTTPKEIFDHASTIYEFLSEVFNEGCMDSVLREWAFQWYSEQTGDSYDNIYNKWLGE